MKTFSLKKLKTKPKIIAQILWDAVPTKQPLPHKGPSSRKIQSMEALQAFQKETEENAGYFFYIDVWEGKPTLLLKQQGKQISAVIARIEEVPETLLWEAIEAQPNPTENLCQEYPITEAIKHWLQQHLPLERKG